MEIDLRSDGFGFNETADDLWDKFEDEEGEDEDHQVHSDEEMSTEDSQLKPQFDPTNESWDFDKYKMKRKINNRQVSRIYITHTNIPFFNDKKEMIIRPGSYSFSSDETDFWIDRYAYKVFELEQLETLTETPLPGCGPILIDIDARFPNDGESGHPQRMTHGITPKEVLWIVKTYQTLCKRYIFNSEIDKHDREIDEYLTAYVLMRPYPRRDQVKGETMIKDGVHIQFPNFRLNYNVQHFFRSIIIQKAQEEHFLKDKQNLQPFEELFDKAVIGRNPWIVYGSTKPKTLPYTINAILRGFGTKPDRTLKEELRRDPKRALRILSIRREDTPSFDIKHTRCEKWQEFQTSQNGGSSSGGGNGGGPRPTTTVQPLPASNANMSQAITSIHDFKRRMFSLPIDETDDDKRDNHIKIQYAIRLMEIISPQRAMTYETRTPIGMALYSVSPTLEPIWMEFCQHKPGLTDEKLKKRKDHWFGFGNREVGKSRYSLGSLVFWAKEDDTNGKFQELWEMNVEREILFIPNDSAMYIANTLARLFSHKNRVVQHSKGVVWYECKNGLWCKSEQGVSIWNKMRTEFFSGINKLRTKISNLIKDITSEELRGIVKTVIFNSKINESKIEQNEEFQESRYIIETLGIRDVSGFTQHITYEDYSVAKQLGYRTKRINNIWAKLQDTNQMTKYMKECQMNDGFQDPTLVERLDENRHLLGFLDGVYDLDKLEFRPYHPDDYVSFTTRMNFPSEYNRDHPMVHEVNQFIRQVLVDDDLRMYTMKALASTLYGGNKEEKFFVLIGSGSNGKSKLMKLHEKAFGDYIMNVSVQLFLGKRPDPNTATPALADCPGKRIAICQEPNEGEQINAGIVKEMSGGDTIVVRKLFQDPRTVEPQHTFFMMTNHALKAPHNDEGTWRRMRFIHFRSKFVDVPDPDNSYHFKINRELGAKLETIEWRMAYMFILLEYYKIYKEEGLVEPPTVLHDTEKYRHEFNTIQEFVNEKLVYNEDDSHLVLKISTIHQEYNIWHRDRYFGGSNKIPTFRQIKDYLEGIYGKYPSTGWKGLKFANSD